MTREAVDCWAIRFILTFLLLSNLLAFVLGLAIGMGNY